MWDVDGLDEFDGVMLKLRTRLLGEFLRNVRISYHKMHMNRKSQDDLTYTDQREVAFV